jgi:hypothetical protein
MARNRNAAASCGKAFVTAQAPRWNPERRRSMKTIKSAFKTAVALTRREEGHAAAWGGGGLLTIALVVLLLILIF